MYDQSEHDDKNSTPILATLHTTKIPDITFTLYY